MKLVKYQTQAGSIGGGVLVDEDIIHPLDFRPGSIENLEQLLDSEHLKDEIHARQNASAALSLNDVRLLAPIDFQEVWAAGVTYTRSKAARMEESEAAASCYDRVYVSARPELFLKATPHRVVGPEQAIRVRADSSWNVPEPEVTLVLNSRLEWVGMTIGNDVSSREIEGENPLYLPQAKVYNQCCSLGPAICLLDQLPPPDEMGIRLRVRRNEQTIFEGSTSVSEMARSFEDLIHWLTRENDFPHGAFLMTGTGIVPDREFTLLDGDLVEIEVDGIGCLRNPVVQRQTLSS